MWSALRRQRSDVSLVARSDDWAVQFGASRLTGSGGLTRALETSVAALKAKPRRGGRAHVFLSGAYIQTFTAQLPSGLGKGEELERWLALAADRALGLAPEGGRAVWAASTWPAEVLVCGMDLEILHSIEEALSAWQVECISPMWALLTKERLNSFSGAVDFFAHDGDCAHRLSFDGLGRCTSVQARALSWEEGERWFRRQSLAMDGPTSTWIGRWQSPRDDDVLPHAWQEVKPQ